VAKRNMFVKYGPAEPESRPAEIAERICPSI